MVRVAGGFGAEKGPELGLVVGEALAARPTRLVFDLSAVTWFDEPGFAAVLLARNTARDQGVGFAVRRPSRAVTERFDRYSAWRLFGTTD